MNGMVWSEVLDNLNGRNHIAVSGDNYGDVASLFKHIHQHASSHSYIRFFLFVGLVFKTAVLAFELLFLIPAQMEFEFWIEKIDAEKNVLIISGLLVVNRTC